MRRQQWMVRVLVATGPLLAAGPAWAELHVVNQIGFTYSPSSITVAPGDTVRWVWSSGSHTVTSGTPCTADGMFGSPLTSANPVFEWVVPTGDPFIPYFCVPHCGMGMTGMINVVSDSIVNFTITMDGYQEYPTPVESTTATGTGTATLDTETGLFSWNITFSGLSSAQTAAHFHGPAGVCASASPVITLPLGSPIVGSQALTAEQMEDLLGGLWYVNVHSTNFTGGEIRGRVAPVELADPIPTSPATGDIRVDLHHIATGLVAPNWAVSAPGDASRLFVVDQPGQLWAINLQTLERSVFLDVSSRLVSLGISGPGTFDERGFLGVAFHPDYQTNGLLYTYTSEPDSAEPDFSTMPEDTPPNHQTVILEWHVPDPGNPESVVDPESAREVLRIDQPQFNHNAGAMNFGPDGQLYIVLGDGGGRDDRDDGVSLGVDLEGHGCEGNGQNLNSILGKVLRIDPLGTDGINGQYGIPDDNPFVGVDGLDEVWAYGFRNPFRFSFDRETGDLWLGDVGQNDLEEVDIVTAGGNYGWRWKEGSYTFIFNGNQAAYVTTEPLDVPSGLIDPVAEYDHTEGIAVLGGFVFRGTTRPQLVGKYVFGDNLARFFYLDPSSGTPPYEILNFDLGDVELDLSVLGFGEDGRGEVYMLANETGTPFDTTGQVLRVALLADVNCDGVVNAFDIDPFVAALVTPDSYSTTYPDCNIWNADVNNDMSIDAFDIDAFIAVLTG